MVWWTGLALWQFEFPVPGSRKCLISTFPSSGKMQLFTCPSQSQFTHKAVNLVQISTATLACYTYHIYPSISLSYCIDQLHPYVIPSTKSVLTRSRLAAGSSEIDVPGTTWCSAFTHHFHPSFFLNNEKCFRWKKNRIKKLPVSLQVHPAGFESDPDYFHSCGELRNGCARYHVTLACDKHHLRPSTISSVLLLHSAISPASDFFYQLHPSITLACYTYHLRPSIIPDTKSVFGGESDLN